MNNRMKEEMNKIRIPKELHQRSMIGISKAKSEHKKRRIINPLISVAITIILVLGISLVSPAVASTLQSLPFVGSIFGMVGDKGMQQADSQGFTKGLSQEISVGDSSFVITDLIYDGSRLSLGFIVTNYQNENPFTDASFKIDGEDFYGGASSQGELINDTDYAGVFTLTVPNELKRVSFNLVIKVKEFNGEKGTWKFTIPVSKIAGEYFLMNEQVASKDYNIRMKKITFTPATTEINFDLTEPVNVQELNQIIRFRLFDDKGNMLEELSAGGGGCSNCETIDGKITVDTSVQYEPMEYIPEFIIIEPYISASGESINELRMKIPIKYR